jgi:hypothetical protein
LQYFDGRQNGGLVIDGTIARRPLSVALENPYIRIALDAQSQRHHHLIFDMRFRAIFRSLAAFICPLRDSRFLTAIYRENAPR